MGARAGCRGAIALVVAGVLLGACSDTKPAQVVTSPAAHHRPYSDVNPPPRQSGDLVVKVLSVSRGAPEDDGHPQRPDPRGPEYWGEEVRTCLKTTAADPEPVGWGDWRAVATDGHRYPADPHAGQPLRTPAYPVHRQLAPGDCVTGWWLITVPHGTDVRAIQLAPGGGAALIGWPTLR
jgi:hypothetical protein